MAKLDDALPISASDYVDDPDACYDWTNEYVLVRDTSMMATFKNLILAINLLGERGWETLSCAADTNGAILALLRNTAVKRKRDRMDPQV